MNNNTSKLEMLREKAITMKEKSPVLLGVILLVTSFLISRVLHLFYDLTGILAGDSHLELMIKELIFVGEVVVALWLTGQKHIFRNKLKGFFSTFWSGTVILLSIILTIIIDLVMAAQDGMAMRSIPEIVMFGVFLLAVGFAEEVFFRGIIFEGINRKYGNTGLGALFAVLSSSVIFGCAHISNAFVGQALDVTIIQIICTTFIGFVFGVIYLKRRNIFAIALIHALFDLAAMYLNGVYNIGSLLESNSTDAALPSIGILIADNGFYFILGIIIFLPYMIKLNKNRKQQLPAAAAA